MDYLFDFPKNAFFGRVIPKAKFYEHTAISKKIRDMFVKQIEKIVWEYKLAPETINLPAMSGIEEIQIFKLVLKTNEIDHEILRCIDKAVKYPIIFEVHACDNVKMIAAYKIPNENNGDQLVYGGYYSTPWFSLSNQRTPLKLALNLHSVYQQIITSLIPLTLRTGESLHSLVERYELMEKMKNDQKKVESKIAHEKQFNKKVELNSILRKIKDNLNNLAL